MNELLSVPVRVLNPTAPARSAPVRAGRALRGYASVVLIPVSLLAVLLVLAVMASHAAAATGGCGGG